ncbi:hypothetical protein FH972_024749 [Carpinus fangiana]|uniref:Uncharacterized protein n=1 Tax=Carpinus fangiana TaxID=176857 RepID=A0A5N6KZE8_9ROSI|nr:hypothetical protein FH972_024749 [Carpinus fangiana]
MQAKVMTCARSSFGSFFCFPDPSLSVHSPSHSYFFTFVTALSLSLARSFSALVAGSPNGFFRVRFDCCPVVLLAVIAIDSNFPAKALSAY